MDETSDTEIDVVSFLATSSDSDSDVDCGHELEQNKHRPQNINSEKCSEVIQMQIKNRLTHKATHRVVNFTNSMPGASIKIPRNPIKHVTRDIDFQILFNCDSCNEIIVNENACNHCGHSYKKNSKQNNFLVYIPLEAQIRRLLNKYFNKIIDYLNREHNDDIISDVDDGSLFKQICEKYPHVKILGFTLNTDGANIYKSSKGSLWPVQLFANFLPPNIRYAHENIIISTIYYGNKKPNMTDLLYPLAAEFNLLNEKLIIMYKENEFWSFRPTVIFGVFDLPARAEIQGMKGPIGKYGCPFCLHQGDPVKNLSGKTTIRYVHKSMEQKLRTHADTVYLYQRVSKEDFLGADAKDSINGVKASSPLMLFDDIDIINSLPIDFMHGICLGIVKDLIEIWIGKKRIPVPPYND